MKKVIAWILGLLVLAAILGAFMFLYRQSKKQPVVFETEGSETTDIVKKTVATGSIVAQKLGDVALGRSVRSAFVTSLDVMLVVCGGIAVGAVFLALAFLPRRSGSTPTPIRASGEVVSADDRLPGSTLGAAVSSQTP